MMRPFRPLRVRVLEDGRAGHRHSQANQPGRNGERSTDATGPSPRIEGGRGVRPPDFASVAAEI